MVLAGIGGLGAPELMIILVIVVVLFGAGRLAGIGGALGQSIREFRKASSDPEEEARKRREEELKAAEQAGRYTPTAPTAPPTSAPPAATGAAGTEYRPADNGTAPPAPTGTGSSTTARPPDFTGR